MGFNRKLSLQWRVFVMVLGLGSVAVHAGPPLIWHPFEIGKAKSLPWGGGSSWNSPDRWEIGGRPTCSPISF